MKNLLLAGALLLATGACTTTAHGPNSADWLNFGIRYNNEHGSIAIGGGQSNYNGGYYYPSYGHGYSTNYNHYPHSYAVTPRWPPGKYGPYRGKWEGPLPRNCYIDYSNGPHSRYNRFFILLCI